jgi:hypothetical protein
VVIAYLMKLRGWRLAESYKWVKDKRPNIKISEGVRWHVVGARTVVVTASWDAARRHPSNLHGGCLQSAWQHGGVGAQLCCMCVCVVCVTCAGDTKRLQELEVKMMGSCSAPSGFAFMSLPGESGVGVGVGGR